MSVKLDILATMGICLYTHNTEKALQETLKKLSALYKNAGDKKGIRELFYYKNIAKVKGKLIEGVRLALDVLEEASAVVASIHYKENRYEVVLSAHDFEGLVFTEANLLESVLLHCSCAMGWTDRVFCLIPRKDCGFSGKGYILEV